MWTKHKLVKWDFEMKERNGKEEGNFRHFGQIE
jgi:hypothetical protein